MIGLSPSKGNTLTIDNTLINDNEIAYCDDVNGILKIVKVMKR